MMNQAEIAALAGRNVDGSKLDERPSTESLAIAAFEARERVIALSMMNTPIDYTERKKMAVELAMAREAAFHAQQKLDARLRGE
jgi:hypothetical protein